MLTVALTGCGAIEEKADQAAENASDRVGQEVRGQVNRSCANAVRAAERTAASSRTSGERFSQELAAGLGSRYRRMVVGVVEALPAEATHRGLADGISRPVPADQRLAWRAMAIEVCTRQLSRQLGQR